jgi:hypothetical protein
MAFLIGLILVSSPAFLAAQAEGPDPEDGDSERPSQGRLRIGLDGGVNISQYYGDTLSDQLPTNVLRAPYGGIRLSYLISDKLDSQFFLESGVKFASKGVRRERYIDIQGGAELDSSLSVAFTDYLGYLQVPVLARVELGAGDVQPFITIGPVFGLNLIAQQETKMTFRDDDFERNASGTIDSVAGLPVINKNRYTTHQTEEISDQSLFEIGALLKLGVDIRLTRRLDLFIEGRYDLGFTPIRDEKTVQERGPEGQLREKTTTSTLRTQTIGFGAALEYKF